MGGTGTGSQAVASSATGMRLVSLTDLKIFLEKTDTNQDSLLKQIIEEVSASIETYLNRNLLKTARTIYRDAGKRYYYLPAYPIDESLTLTVTCDGVASTKDTDYFVRAADGLIEFQKAAIPAYEDPKEVVIIWTGGYATSGEGDTECYNVPSVIQAATRRQSAYNFRRRKDIGISSVSMPDGSISKNPIDSFLLPEVKELLKNFRRPAGEY